ncbi:MAG: hypothetical protein JWP30_69 [Homoserinimonas sp.]|nr:hypothetical protein [Homoserinimonas sp.]
MTSLMRKAWWWTADYAYAVYWQARSMSIWIKPQKYLSGAARPVVVIPGIYESWQFMRPLIDALHARGHPVHVVTMLQRNSRPVPAAARIVADYLAEHQLRNVVIVAHSKGGLIGKFVMLDLDTERRVEAMVAVCTPFSGSRYARYLVIPSLRAFSPRDMTTSRLSRDLATNTRITSVFGLFDPHIPEGSELAGARNIRLNLGGHFRIMGNPRTIQTVVEAVTDD